MSFRTSDGHEFPTRQRAELYERSLPEQRSLVARGKDDFENAPGGAAWEHDRKTHGPVLESTIKYEGPGRWRVTAKHGDGYTHTSVHPQRARADEVQDHLLDLDQPPAALQTHQRAKATPQGPKESERIRLEDHREDEETP